METVDLASMFLLGLLGTGHCVGMCGPIVVALPGSSRRLPAHLAYHAGRVTTYAGVGALVAALGAGLGRAAASSGTDPIGTVARLGVVVSLVAALVMLVLGLARLGVVREPALLSTASPSRLPWLRAVQERAFGGSVFAVLLLGLLLGLLPCGLSYAAFARVLPVADPVRGGLLVAAFGAGTVPGLLLLGGGGAAFARRHARTADLLSGVLLVGMAVRVAVDGIVALL